MKGEHSARTNREESNMHNLRRRKRKTESVVCDSVCKANELETNLSVKQKPTKVGRQTEAVACLGFEVTSDRKEKTHKKRTVSKNDGERLKTVSSTSHELQNRKLKDTETTQETDVNVIKFVATDDTDANVQSRSLGPSCEETSAFRIKKKSRKKRKWPHNESVHDKLANEQTADTNTVKKRKKNAQNAGKEITLTASTEHTDSATASSSQYRALEYLRTWKSAHDNWTFQKVRQVWLLQHMYDPNKVITCLILSWNLYLQKCNS